MMQRVALAGLGAIGWRVAERLDADLEGLRLHAVSARDQAAARTRLERLTSRPEVRPLETLSDAADVLVECLPPSLFREAVHPMLQRGGVVVTASVGALLENDDMIRLARETGGRILVPSGAIAGLDGVRSGAEAGLEEVRVITRKPPGAFGENVSLEDQRVATAEISAALKVFSGTAREAIRRFPANVNVAGAVSLAGLGANRTMVEVWADPGVERNEHRLILRSRSNEMETRVVNLPDPENPGSSSITAYSIVALLRRLVEPVSIGT